jgi:O-acetyl-ADP-ribose deacetylase (regulator of RNase III)
MNNFILADISEDLINECKQCFSKYSNFSFHLGDVFEKTADFITSPANSFSMMRGGIDGVYTRKMGIQLEERLREKVKNDYYGEVLVGQTCVIETNFPQFPYLISAPTMRVSSDIQNTPNIYLCARAIFIEMQKHENKTCLIPGLGTGVGGVSAKNCARLMLKAYEDICLDGYLNDIPKNMQAAIIKHNVELC